MIREHFWEILDGAMSAAAFDRAALPDALREELLGHSAGDVLAFLRHFHDVRAEAYRWELWGAAWVAGGGASEDDFGDFRDWLISLGREAFDDTLRHPDRLLDHADPAELRDPFDPDVRAAAFGAYAELTGADEPPGDAFRPHPAAPAGRRWKPEDLPRLFPRLWRFYNP